MHDLSTLMTAPIEFSMQHGSKRLTVNAISTFFFEWNQHLVSPTAITTLTPGPIATILSSPFQSITSHLHLQYTLPEAAWTIYTWQSLSAKGTRQRALGKQFIGKDLFAECTLSGTRQRLCRAPIRHSAKKSGRDGERHRDGGFAECQGQTLGKGPRFAECR